MQLMQRTISSERTELVHPLTIDFVWLDYTYARHGNLFSPNIIGIFLFNRWHEAKKLEEAWISYRDALKETLCKTIFENRRKTFPDFTYNIELGKLIFEQGRVWNPNSGYSLYCSSRADLEERLDLANITGSEILAFKADGTFYAGEDNAQKHLDLIGDEIASPFDEHLKMNPQKLLDFTKNRIRRVYVSQGENGARESIAYPELLGKEIYVRYMDSEIPDLVQVGRNGNKSIVLLDYQLTKQPLKVVRGAICVGLSKLARENDEKVPLALLQMDAFARGFPREIMAYTSYVEVNGRLSNGLTSDQITAVVRQSQSILGDNLFNPLYSNRDGYIPPKID